MAQALPKPNVSLAYLAGDVDRTLGAHYDTGVMAVGSPPLWIRRWKRLEYERLVEQGTFHGEHLELLDGLLVVREPQGSRHAAAVTAIRDVLARAFGEGYVIRPHLPVALDDRSEQA